MIAYLINVGLVICAIFVFYKVLLHNGTFYRLNRFVLIICLLLAFVLPFVHLPQKWSFKTPSLINTVNSSIDLASSASGAEKKVLTTVAPLNLEADQEGAFSAITIAQVLIYAYWIGVAIFTINFVVQLLSLLYRAYSRPVIRDGRYRIVELTGAQAPCSFGNNIFINPEKYDWDTYSQILLHEKIHVQQGHSYDIILAELALVFQWFNPFAWLYRKAVEDNLEFLTDDDLLKHQDIDPGSYQLSLVKVSVPHFPVNLTTNYNQSILKRRLIMMNAKKSNINTTWKYLFIAPILGGIVCLLNAPVANAKVEPEVVNIANNGLKSIKGMDRLDQEGKWFATIKDNMVNIRFQNNGDENQNNGSSSTFQLSVFKNLPKDQEGDFMLEREAGTMHFYGRFTGNMGMGTYKFSPDRAFAESLKADGINLDDKNDALVCFIIDVQRSYVGMLKKQGYEQISKDELIPLVALKVDQPFITAIKSNGFSDVSLQNLIPLKALGVDETYLAEIKNRDIKI